MCLKTRKCHECYQTSYNRAYGIKSRSSTSFLINRNAKGPERFKNLINACWLASFSFDVDQAVCILYQSKLVLARSKSNLQVRRDLKLSRFDEFTQIDKARWGKRVFQTHLILSFRINNQHKLFIPVPNFVAVSSLEVKWLDWILNFDFFTTRYVSRHQIWCSSRGKVKTTLHTRYTSDKFTCWHEWDHVSCLCSLQPHRNPCDLRWNTCRERNLQFSSHRFWLRVESSTFTSPLSMISQINRASDWFMCIKNY